MRKILLVLTAMIAMGAVVPTATAHGDHDVEIRDGSFDPERLEIRAGDTVEWKNEGERPHSVTADDGSFDSAVIEPGEKFERRFDEAGTYPYGSSAEGDEAVEGIVVVLPADDEGSSGSSGDSSSGSSGEGGSDEAVDGSVPGYSGGGDSAGDGGADAVSAGSAEPASVAGSRSTPVGATGSVRGQAAAVSIQDDVFVPSEVTINVGGTVVWQHAGQNPHTVTAADGSFDSGTLETGSSFSRTFSQPGRFSYYCEFHGAPGQGMAGVVEVLGAPGNADGEEPAAGEQTGGLAASGRSVAAPLGLAVTMLLAGLWLVRRPGSGLSGL